MNTKPVLVSLCAVLVLSACSATKKVSSTTKTASYNTHIFTNIENSTNLDKAQMHIYIQNAKSELLSLELQESKRCIAGQLAIAQSYLTRATAEHNAAMEKDAFITLVDFDRQIRKIRCINQYVKGQLGCSYSQQKVVLKRWYDEGDFNQCDTASSVKKEKPIKVKYTINKNHILITETLHDFNQDEIKPIYYPSLNKLITLIKSYPNSTLLISGHTDSKGSTTYNKQLSKRRAQSVAKYFTDKGIASSQISVKNKGEENIREIEHSDVSRVFNRYTSITLFLDTSGKKEI